MKVLIIGGAGHVGSILRPALEAAHECYYYDRRSVTGAAGRSRLGDVADTAAIADAIRDMHAVIYLAMGVRDDAAGSARGCGDLDLSFNVNVRDFYRTATLALEVGVRRLIYASSLSVYDGKGGAGESTARTIDESVPPDAWSCYGLSKRLGEQVCLAASQKYPAAMILALRLTHPQSEAQWAAVGAGTSRLYGSRRWATAPNDLRRLFLAALEADRPGAHIVQASGDLQGERFPNDRACELLGWRPRGE